MEKHKILFVDDEPNVTAALKRAFRSEPHELLSAGSAKEALEILADQEIDVVVSDEQMPGMSGSEFLTIVCAKYPQTIRLILTGHASLEAAIRAINEGEVYRFFTKPCNEIDLKVTIRQALQHRELALRSRWLLGEYRKQALIVEDLERRDPGITHVETDSTGAYVLGPTVNDMDELLKELEEEMRRRNCRTETI